MNLTRSHVILIYRQNASCLLPGLQPPQPGRDMTTTTRLVMRPCGKIMTMLLEELK
jgi:hypothetical protein